LHVLSILSPDIVTFLSGDGGDDHSNHNGDDDGGNNSSSQSGSLVDVQSQETELRLGSRSGTEATLVDSGSIDLGQEASLDVVASSNVAITLFVGVNSSQDSSTVGILSLAAKDRVADVGEAGGTGGVAGNVGIDATREDFAVRIAKIFGTNALVVANNGRVDVGVNAASVGVAGIRGTGISVITVDRGLGALVVEAAVNDTEIVGIADFGSGFAETIRRVALVDLARDGRADDVVEGAPVAEDGGFGAVIVGAAIREAGVGEGTVMSTSNAPDGGIANFVSAKVVVVAIHGGEFTSSGGIARVGSAKGAIGTNFGRELASSSILVGIAERCLALVVVLGLAQLRAEALLVASTETFAARATGISDNIGTGERGQVGDLCSQTSKVVNVDEEGGIAGKTLYLINVNSGADSNGGNGNSCSLGVGVGSGQVRVGRVHVVDSVSQDDHDFGNSSSTSNREQFLLSKNDTAADASILLVLGNRSHLVDEGGFVLSETNGQASAGIELNEPHGSKLRSKVEGVGQGNSKVLFLLERWGIDRTRLVKHQHNVLFFGTNREGTIGGSLSERRAIDCRGSGKIKDFVVDEDGSTREV